MFMLRLNFINKPKLTSPFKSNLNESDRLRGFSATHTHTQVCSQIFISTAKDGTRQGGGGGVCVCVHRGGHRQREGTGRTGRKTPGLFTQWSSEPTAKPGELPVNTHTHTHTVKFKVKEVQTESLWNGFLSVNINIDNSSMKKKEGRENAP